MKKSALTRVLAVVMTLGLGAMLTGYDASPAFAQADKKAEKATKTQSSKKPAAGCEGMDKKSKAYSDCVKAAAQTTQDTQKATKETKKTEKAETKTAKKEKKTTTQ